MGASRGSLLRIGQASKQLALGHIEALEHRIDEMAAMKHTLSRLTSECQGNDRPAYPILDDLGRSCA